MRILPIAVALLAATVLPGCGDKDAKVTIVYEQDSNFRGFATETGPGTGLGTAEAPAGHIFVMYRIVSIHNTGAAAEPFTFDRTHMTTIQDEFATGHPSQEGLVLGAELIEHPTIGAGVVESDRADLGCFIMEAKVDDPSAFEGKVVDLLHQVVSTVDQPVDMERMEDDTVGTLLGHPSPETLQNRCQGGYF